MHSANLTTAPIKRTSGLLIAVLFSVFSYAQENSPYSKFGMGDITPNRNVLNRGMGGIATGYADFQSINFSNPAAVASLGTTVFDVGGSIDIRVLKSNISPEKFKSVNTGISYLQLGFPLSNWKFRKSDFEKNSTWALSFGLRPVTRINYKIEGNTRLSGVDSLSQVFEGNGGLSQANIATAVKIKNFAIGINSGYSFGTKDFSQKKIFVNDSVIYYKSNSEIQTRFGGLFLTVGAQYDIYLNRHKADSTKNRKILRIGATANLQQNLRAKRDDLDETFNYNGDGGVVAIDTIRYNQNASGTIKYPASYSVGFTYTDNHWIFGADYDIANWKSYSYFGDKDPLVQNNWTIHAGAQYFPASFNTPISKYWNFVKYRAGVYYGNDYVNISKDRPEFGATFGAGLPLTSLRQRNPYGGFATLNLGIELGVRGNKDSQSFREGVTRFSIGFSMNSRWFQKLRYD